VTGTFLALTVYVFSNWRKMPAHASSSVGRISEWEGLRSRRQRRRGGGVGEGVSPPHWGRGLGRGTRAVPPPPKNFAFFASKSHLCDAL